MNIALWAVQVILALVFAGAGFLKATKSNAELQPNMGYVEDFRDGQITAIGIAELAAAVGLVLPGLLDIATILTPIAAVGLVIVMVGAVVTHVRRNEAQMTVPPIVLGLAAAFVAWGRFGSYAF